MSNTNIANASLILSMLAVIITILHFWWNRRSQYDSTAATTNHNFFLDESACKFILNTREQDNFKDNVSEFRYNLHMLGLLQFFQSNISMLKNHWGHVRYRDGYCLLIHSAINCTVGKRFWKSHQILFNRDFRKIINKLLEKKYDDIQIVIYPKFYESNHG